MTPDEILDFYHIVLKHAEFKLDYWAVAAQIYETEESSKSQKDVV